MYVLVHSTLNSDLLCSNLIEPYEKIDGSMMRAPVEIIDNDKNKITVFILPNWSLIFPPIAEPIEYPIKLIDVNNEFWTLFEQPRSNLVTKMYWIIWCFGNILLLFREKQVKKAKNSDLAIYGESGSLGLALRDMNASTSKQLREITLNQ